MQADGGVDEDRYAAFMDWQIDRRHAGVVPIGTTGESPTLSHDEHENASSNCASRSLRGVPVIAGTGSNSTAEAVDAVAGTRRRPAPMRLLVVTPYYNKPTQAGLCPLLRHP